MILSFARLCREELRSVLERYELEQLLIREDAFGCEVRYANGTTGVQVRAEPREARVFVLLCKLVEGRMYVGLGEGRPDTDPNTAGLDDLTALRAPERAVQQPFQPGFRRGQLRQIVRQYAELLPMVAHDVLTGEFEILNTVYGIKLQRRRDWIASWDDKSTSSNVG